VSGRLSGRIAAITGASRGIGRAVALAFAAEGAHIVALASERSQGALAELDGEVRALGAEATLVPLDLTDYAGLDRLGAALCERWGRLDILVGNAGVLGPLSPLPHITPEDWERTWAVNVTANWRLIRSLDPLLRASEAGRAIFVTSGATQKAKAYWGLYSATKAALEKMVEIYAAECEKTTLRVNMIDPGPTRTRMRAAAMPGEDPDILPMPEELAPLFLELAEPACAETGRRIAFRDWREERG